MNAEDLQRIMHIDEFIETINELMVGASESGSGFTEQDAKDFSVMLQMSKAVHIAKMSLISLADEYNNEQGS